MMRNFNLEFFRPREFNKALRALDLMAEGDDEHVIVEYFLEGKDYPYSETHNSQIGDLVVGRFDAVTEYLDTQTIEDWSVVESA